eukprot:4570960-Pyramimonas_sp.AAC.1
MLRAPTGTLRAPGVGGMGAGVLWSISPRLVLFLLGYAFVGTAVTTRIFGGTLARLTHAILQMNADLRFCLVRAREHAEAIGALTRARRGR